MVANKRYELNHEKYEKIGDHVFWRNADDVRPYIFEYLKKEFPNTFIIDELDRIDISILDENLPVEIQSTSFRRNSPLVSNFEDDIRRQLEQNIVISGKCWLFFDGAFLDYIKKGLGTNTSINLDWLYKYFKEEKIRIFTITYNGIIKELKDEDFSFLLSRSLTCKKSEDDDLRILQRNKLKIALSVFKGHRFTTDEIKKLHDTYYDRNDKDDNRDFNRWLVRDGHTGRELECRYIYNAISNLPIINKILSCCCDDYKSIGAGVKSAFSLGLFARTGGVHDKFTKIYFVDTYNISQYTPGYLSNMGLWNYISSHPVDTKTFYSIIKGEYPNFMKERNFQKTIEDSWK